MSFQTRYVDAGFTATSFENDTPFTVYLESTDCISDGGSAKIFTGRTDPSTAPPGVPSLVALKMFVDNMPAHQQQALDRELKAARQLRHANILPYYGTAEVDMHKILISPYMRHGNLLNYLIAHSAMDGRPLLLQVAKAVTYLHETNRVHGDIKCENVLISDDGNAMLADFGLSTVIDRTASGSRTLTGLRMQMTLQFAAPELVIVPEIETSEGGLRNAPGGKTAATDVYAFAMTVIQAFTRRPPWDGYSSIWIMTAMIQKRMHPRPQTGDPAVRLCDEWWNVCVKCLDYDPSERPSMATVLDKLTASSVDSHTTSGQSGDINLQDASATSGGSREPVPPVRPAF